MAVNVVQQAPAGKTRLRPEIGLWMAVTLVVGNNMIGWTVAA